MSELKVVVLAGGVGAARFLGGLVEVDHEIEIIVISNTADDIRLFGLQVCPDLDSVMYGLGGVESAERGWGRENETFNTLEELRAYKAEPDWFQLGDRDIATHLIRTQMLDAGYTLGQVTQALCKRWEVPATLIPMSNDRVETHVVVDDPETDHVKAIHFQEWWVRYRASLPAREFLTIGADKAQPSPGVISAISDADLIILPPSNPVVSINPILSIPGVRQALRLSKAPIVGVSPVIGGEVVRGMADKCLEAISVTPTATGIAAYYGPRPQPGEPGDGLLDGWIIDEQDAENVEPITELGITTIATKTLMSEPGVGKSLAQTSLDLGANLAQERSA